MLFTVQGFIWNQAKVGKNGNLLILGVRISGEICCLN